jgi:hypothetical protein
VEAEVDFRFGPGLGEPGDLGEDKTKFDIFFLRNLPFFVFMV